MRLLSLLCVVLFLLPGLACKGGGFKQQKASLTGTADQQQYVNFNNGAVHFTLQKDYKDAGDDKLTVNLRDGQGSIIKELFHTGDKGSFNSVVDIDTPGQHQLEVSGAKGKYTLSWE